MSLLPWVWLATPFVLIAVISHDSNMRDLISVHHRRCRMIGWAGVAAMILGATVVGSAFGMLLFGFGTPLTGLAVWTPRDDHGDGGDRDPDAPLPEGWDDFERAFWAHVRGGLPPRRPRAPAPR